MDIRKELLAVFELEQREHLAVIRKALARAATGQVVDLKDAFRHAHSLKGAARAVDLADVEASAHRIEALLEQALDQQAPLGTTELDALQASLDAIEGRTDLAAERLAPGQPADRSGSMDAPDAQTPEYLRVAADQVEQMRNSVHHLADVLQERGGLRDSLRDIETALRSLDRELDRGPGQRLRQELKRLSRQVTGVMRQERRNSWALDQSFRGISRNVERISLVPVESFFGGFGAMVRELAREQGRQVEFEIHGLDVQADRRLLQSLRDPVLHQLRNAVSHGAAPEDRTGLGKPPHVTIKLVFEVRGAQLDVTVTDDGPGPDLAAIEARGIELGLIVERAPDEPLRAPADVLRLVFEPGFSTARQVDQLSGRGMGLSVVAEDGVLQLGDDAKINNQRPAATALFQSIADHVGEGGVGVLLTGMGEDGAQGLLSLRKSGGLTITEDATTAVVYGMPAAAVRLGASQVSLPLDLIAARLLQLSREAA